MSNATYSLSPSVAPKLFYFILLPSMMLLSLLVPMLSTSTVACILVTVKANRFGRLEFSICFDSNVFRQSGFPAKRSGFLTDFCANFPSFILSHSQRFCQSKQKLNNKDVSLRFDVVSNRFLKLWTGDSNPLWFSSSDKNERLFVRRCCEAKKYAFSGMQRTHLALLCARHRNEDLWAFGSLYAHI